MRAWRFHDEGFVPCHLPREDKCLAPIALGLRPCKRIEGLHGAAGDLHHHNSMGCWRMAKQVTLHTYNRVAAAPYRLAEVIETPSLVEPDTCSGMDETGVGGRECDAETGTPEDCADLLCRPHHTEPCQHHAHTGCHA